MPPERADELLRQRGRDPFREHALLLREGDDRLVAHLPEGPVERRRAAVSGTQEALARHVRHRATHGRVERVGVEREEDGPLGRDRLPAGPGPPQDRVREVPAEIHAGHRVAEPVRRVGEEDAALRVRQAVAIRDVPADSGLARQHHDLGARRLEEDLPEARGDVVDVGRLPDAVVERPGVPSPVPGVDDDAHAGEAARLRGRREVRRLGPLLLPRGGPGIVRWKVLLGEELERDLHREADRDRVDVVDSRTGARSSGRARSRPRRAGVR